MKKYAMNPGDQHQLIRDVLNHKVVKTVIDETQDEMNVYAAIGIDEEQSDNPTSLLSSFRLMVLSDED